jgi:hypothetical protein
LGQNKLSPSHSNKTVKFHKGLSGHEKFVSRTESEKTE